MDRVAQFIAATRDDPERWIHHAPPSLAGAALFAVAPKLLGDPSIATRQVVHGQQLFVWHGPLSIGLVTEVMGKVGRVRHRGDTTFVEFVVTVASEGRPLVEGSSTFVLPEVRADSGPERAEPPAAATGPNTPWPAPARSPLLRSASRADLVRYAGASQDWNPIHWDHASARAGGLPGTVVHGLLQAAWALQAASLQQPGPHPVAEARFRFRRPLFPSVGVEVRGRGPGELEVAAGEEVFMEASLR
jgi:hydroxyacyl-ACP dehydratase HTD2-like protein with hotdog domain